MCNVEWTHSLQPFRLLSSLTTRHIEADRSNKMKAIKLQTRPKHKKKNTLIRKSASLVALCISTWALWNRTTRLLKSNFCQNINSVKFLFHKEHRNVCIVLKLCDLNIWSGSIRKQLTQGTKAWDFGHLISSDHLTLSWSKPKPTGRSKAQVHLSLPGPRPYFRVKHTRYMWPASESYLGTYIRWRKGKTTIELRRGLRTMKKLKANTPNSRVPRK